MKRGDIVLVDYPFSDGSSSKVRPALVIQADSLNRSQQDTIIALITSRMQRVADSTVGIDLKTPDGVATGLRTDSTVRCAHVYTVSKHAVLRVLGSLSETLMDDVRKALRSVFEI